MTSKDDKQYGLILPKSKQNLAGPKPKLAKSSIFGDGNSSSSEDDCTTDWMKKKLQAKSNSSTSAGHSGGMKKQAKVGIFGLATCLTFPAINLEGAQNSPTYTAAGPSILHIQNI